MADDHALPLDPLVDEAPGLGFNFDHPGWKGVIVSVVIAAVTALVVCAAALVIVWGDNDRTIKRATAQAQVAAERNALSASAKGCDRSNVKNALTRLAAWRSPSMSHQLRALTDFSYPILDCKATYLSDAAGKAVPLVRDLDQCFVRLTERGYWLHQDSTSDPRVLTPLCKREQ